LLICEDVYMLWSMVATREGTAELAHLLRRQEQLLRQQESLRAVIEAISGELELRPLLTSIVQHACELIGAERGTIGLVDEVCHVVRTEAVYRMPPDELGAEMEPGVGLAGKVLETQQPLVLNHYGELELPTQPDLYQDAVVGLPIFWGGRMIGFFGIGADPPRRFDDHDVEMLQLFARHAAVAIENARLYESEKRRAARLTTVNRIGKLIASRLALDELLQTAVSALGELLNYTHVALLLVDRQDPEMLALVVRSGMYASAVQGSYRQSIHEGVIGAAATGRKPVLVADVRQDSRYVPIPGHEEIRSEIAVPLLAGGELAGVLNVESGQPFSREDVADLELVADQLGVAIANARLFEQTQQTLAETQLLYETGRRINAAIELDDVVMAHLEQVATRGRYWCSVVLYEFDEWGQKAAVVLRGRRTPQEGLQIGEERFPYSYDDLDPPLDAGQTITIRDVFNDPRVSDSLREIQRQSGRPALVMIPLMAHGERFGLVILTYPAVHDWTEADLWPYQVTAAQLATAIYTRQQQALLYERGREVAVLRERQRLARELHDSVTQLIFSMTLIAQSIVPAWRRDAAEGQQRVERLLQLSQDALAEMRALLFELRLPEVPADATAEGGQVDEMGKIPGIVRLKRDGLVQALERHLEGIAGDGLSVQFEASAYRPLSLDCEIALYRVTQEALNNVVKHARAQHVRIELAESEGAVSLLVIDDGIGFAAEHGEGRQTRGRFAHVGLGLRTMRERVEALGGNFGVQSSPGKGTKVEVFVPGKERLESGG
jgi:signal transduction histidine kinase